MNDIRFHIKDVFSFSLDKTKLLAAKHPTACVILGAIAVVGGLTALKHRYASQPWQGKQFIHIGQLHSDPFTGRTDDDVVQSQLNVAQIISKNPHIPVMSESLGINIQDDPFNQRGSTACRIAFHDGVPLQVKDLTKYQRQLLSWIDAPKVLFFSEKISSVYAVTRPENRKRIAKALEQSLINPSSIGKAFHFMREQEVIECAKKILSTHSKVFVVFGSAHDFAPICAAAGLLHEKIEAVPEECRHLIAEARKQQFS